MGAGTTLGGYKYHIEIYLKFLHLVKAWINLEKDDCNKLEIGIVDCQDWGPDIKWVIIYHVPYINPFAEDTTFSGLVVGLATTTLSNTSIGIPHIQGTVLM